MRVDLRGARPPSCLTLAALLLCTTLAFSARAAPLAVDTSIWPPYVDPRLPGQGLAISIVTTALERAGYEPAVTIRQWEGILQDAKTGRASVIAAAWRTPERQKDLLFSDPYLVNEIKLLKLRKRDIRFESLEDLRGLRIGIVYGFAYDDTFDADPRLLKVPESHIVPNLLQLLAGEIDVTLGDERTLRYEISRHLKDRKHDLEHLVKPLASRDLHLAVSRRDPRAEEIVREFNQALAAIREDGTYRKLVRQANEEIWTQAYLPRRGS